MDAKDAVPHAARRERRWWRYSLRSLFLLTTVLAAACSWFAVRANRAARQRDAVAALTKLGGFVCYDYQLDSRSPVPPWHPREPLWMQKLLGVDFFADVVSVTLGCDRELGYLGNLPRLKSLRIDDSGSPEFAITRAGLKAIGGVTRVEELEIVLDECDDSALEPISKLANLRFLFVCCPNMRGGWLRYVERLGAIKTIEVHDGGASDADLEGLAGLCQLEVVAIRDAKVRGPGLASLGALQRLKTLDLSGCPIASLKHLPSLPRLEVLTLSECDVTDAGLPRADRSPKLHELALAGAKVTDAGLDCLTGFNQLESLDLSSTAITDAGLIRLVGLSKLRRLDLRNNSRITNSGLRYIEKLTGLQEFLCSDTLVTEEGVKRLQSVLPKCSVFSGRATMKSRPQNRRLFGQE